MNNKVIECKILCTNQEEVEKYGAKEIDYWQDATFHMDDITMIQDAVDSDNTWVTLTTGDRFCANIPYTDVKDLWLNHLKNDDIKYFN
jgi:hypothetical protein